MQITLDLTEHQMQRILREVKRGQQTVDQFVKNAVLDKLALFPRHPEYEMMAMERAAYRQLHPDLVRTHLGQYVAIHGGELVDNDTDIDALLARRIANYGDKIVMVTEVEVQPISLISARI